MSIMINLLAATASHVLALRFKAKIKVLYGLHTMFNFRVKLLAF